MKQTFPFLNEVAHLFGRLQISDFILTQVIIKRLTPWGRALLKKLIVSQLVKKCPAFYEPKGLLPCSQEPTTEGLS
jgi:hypothetical protein